MSIAQQKALELRHRFRLCDPLCDDTIDRLYRTYRLRLTIYPFAGRIKEVLYGRTVGISPHIDRSERRWLRVHALGHQLMHLGVRLRPDRFFVLYRQERQAELFAGWLFLADTWTKMPAWELAEYHCLPQERIERWLKLQAGETAIAAS